jgi:hypothetical protein
METENDWSDTLRIQQKSGMVHGLSIVNTCHMSWWTIPDQSQLVNVSARTHKQSSWLGRLAQILILLDIIIWASIDNAYEYFNALISEATDKSFDVKTEDTPWIHPWLPQRPPIWQLTSSYLLTLEHLLQCEFRQRLNLRASR